MATRWAYLHGLGSGPRSTKGTALARAFEERGLPFDRPDLNRPSFARLSHAAMLAAVDALAGGGETFRFVGSSLGGWLAARWAELHPDRVDRLVLLCPGFDLAGRWPVMLGQDEMRRWRERGERTWPDAEGRPVGVHYGFYEEACRQKAVPEVSCPTLIVHGVRDEVVPVDGSRAYAAARPHVRLVELDDDHSLGASIDRVVEESLRFLVDPGDVS